MLAGRENRRACSRLRRPHLVRIGVIVPPTEGRPFAEFSMRSESVVEVEPARDHEVKVLPASGNFRRLLQMRVDAVTYAERARLESAIFSRIEVLTRTFRHYFSCPFFSRL